MSILVPGTQNPQNRDQVDTHLQVAGNKKAQSAACVLETENGTAPMSLEAESATIGAQIASKRQNKPVPPANTALALPLSCAAGEERRLPGPALPSVDSAGSPDTSVQQTGSNAATQETKNAPARDIPTVPTPVETPARLHVKTPSKPRGPEIPLHPVTGRKALMRFVGGLIRKTKREWDPEPAQPGRIMAQAMLAKTAQGLLDSAASEKELEEADQLHRLLQDLKGVRVGHA